MSRFYEEYSHIKCDDPRCNGAVRWADNVGNQFICHTCGKSVGYHYVESQRKVVYINDKTGWVFPMKRKIKEVN